MTLRKSLLVGVLTGLLGATPGWADQNEVVIQRAGQADPIRITVTTEISGPDNVMDIGEEPAGPPIHLIWDKPSYWYSADRTVFYLRGPVEFEFPDVIRSLDQRVRTLVLTSHGGYVQPALEAIKLIRKKGYTTYVPLYCHSACTFLFAAGTQRVADPRATFIVHGADHDTSGITDAGQLRWYEQEGEALNSSLPLVLAEFGVDRDFIAKALRLPRSLHQRELDARSAKSYGLATVVEKAVHNF